MSSSSSVEETDYAPSGLPFEHLNLRCNPFGTVGPEALARLAVADVEEAVKHLRRPNTALQLVGKRGRGKSTRLRMIHRHFPEPPWIYVARAGRVRVPADPFPFFDEFQRVDASTRARIYRSAGRLAVSTHRDVSDELEASGFDVRTARVGVRDPARLKKIIDQRIEWARRSEGPVPRVTERAVRHLQNKFGTDLRSMFDELYKVFQNLEKPGDVRLRDLD